MKLKQFCSLLAVLLILSACSQMKSIFPVDADFYEDEPFDTTVVGAYSGYGSQSALRYYKNVLSSKRWKQIEVLNYSDGYFAFPPLCGYRVLHYENERNQTIVDLFREVIDGDNYVDIITRRQTSDHCNFSSTLYRQLQDIDIVEATADCYLWLYGDFVRKYYFLRAGNVVYTFRLLSPPQQYALAEPDFDYFVDTTVDNYLIYSPRQQEPPFPTNFADEGKPKKKRKQAIFSRDELVSFFSPVANQNMLVH